ncbi:hypothetical protein KIN20_003611 [Parelaphostrongylus tenuis]|uniref:Uncharacterized protein n=1 Tax=Parelaphostrongylus tenuis TaxID=148309 RepID=A0AAD5M1R5_PARTN|nr:hypothetical protein KIN20_003611 [Parelaphostrongylus tenuis]
MIRTAINTHMLDSKRPIQVQGKVVMTKTALRRLLNRNSELGWVRYLIAVSLRSECAHAAHFPSSNSSLMSYSKFIEL